MEEGQASDYRKEDELGTASGEEQLPVCSCLSLRHGVAPIGSVDCKRECSEKGCLDDECLDGLCCRRVARNRKILLYMAMLFAAFTVAYSVAESATSIYFGVASGSLSLLEFGADSMVEIIAGFMVMWRLCMEYKRFMGGPLVYERIATIVINSLLVCGGVAIMIS